MKIYTLKETFNGKYNRLITLTVVAGFLLVWEFFALIGKISPIIFPAPTLILSSFFKDLVMGKFSQDVIISLSRIFTGFLIGGGAGLCLGLIMGWSRGMREILDPIVAALHPIPKLALLPMVIIFFGLGESSRSVMVCISAFFPMLINTMVGVLQINPTYYEVVENYGATRLDIFRKVVLPGSLPFVLSGARLSLKSALTITIGVEMVFGNKGLGSVLWLAWETMRMTNMYAAILIVSLIGVSFAWLLEKSKKIVIPWHQEIRSS
jgi:ABC-type nitrate/sulfonate/bicarbonate transport system permease component